MKKMKQFEIDNLKGMKKASLISWFVVFFVLGLPILLWGEPKDQTPLVMLIVISIDSLVCFPMFFYAYYKLLAKGNMNLNNYL